MAKTKPRASNIVNNKLDTKEKEVDPYRLAKQRDRDGKDV